jgi:hypothetical protein
MLRPADHPRARTAFRFCPPPHLRCLLACDRCEKLFQVLASSKTGIEHLALQLGIAKVDPKPPPAARVGPSPLGPPPAPLSPTSQASTSEHPDPDPSIAVLAACEEKEAALLAATVEAAARPVAKPAAPPPAKLSSLSRPPRAAGLSKEASLDRVSSMVAEAAARISSRALMSRERGLDRWPTAADGEGGEEHDAPDTRRESEKRPEEGGGGAEEGGGAQPLHSRFGSVKLMEGGPKSGSKKEAKSKGGQQSGRKEAGPTLSAVSKVMQVRT